MTNSGIRIKLEMAVNPHCYWCKERVIEYHPKEKEQFPDWAATIDHIYSRKEVTDREKAYIEGRKSGLSGRYYVLSCYKCNHDRSIKQWRGPNK